MAEFGQTMRQWKRMCDYCEKDHPGESCEYCPACKFNCGGVFEMSADTDWNKLAEIVEKWAKENPEPQYPTWWEWLAEKGIVPLQVKPDVAFELTETGLVDPIPADIAEKLGLKPKEAANNAGH